MSIAKLIKIMQEEGSKQNPPLPFVGEVTGMNPLKVSFNNIDIDDDQIYLISETISKDDTVIVFPTFDSNKFVIARVVET